MECLLFTEKLVRPASTLLFTSASYDSGSPFAVSPLMDSMHSESTVYIHVLDVNEPPEGASKEFVIPEDAKMGTVIGTVKSRDPDAGQSVKYGIQRENCFEISTGTTRHYKQLPPVYQGKQLSTTYFRVKATASVHILLARSSTAIEVNFAAGEQRQHEIRYCTKYSPAPVPTADQCKTFATSNFALAFSAHDYEELWVNVNPATQEVRVGHGPDEGASGSTLMSAHVNATLAPFTYAVSTGDGHHGHFAGVCLPVESEQDTGVFSIDSSSGVLRIRKNILDYEVRSAYGIQVLLSDEGPTAVPSLNSFTFVRVQIEDVNEPPEFQGSVAATVKSTSLVGCFYDKSTAVTPRLHPDPLRDLP